MDGCSNARLENPAAKTRKGSAIRVGSASGFSRAYPPFKAALEQVSIENIHPQNLKYAHSGV